MKRTLMTSVSYRIVSWYKFSRMHPSQTRKSKTSTPVSWYTAAATAGVVYWNVGANVCHSKTQCDVACRRHWPGNIDDWCNRTAPCNRRESGKESQITSPVIMVSTDAAVPACHVAMAT